MTLKKKIPKLNIFLKNPYILAYYRVIKRTVKRSFKGLMKFFAKVREKRKKSDAFDLFIWILQLAGVMLIIFSLSAACIFFQIGDRFDRSIYVINVPKGYGAYSVGDLLVERGVINGKYGFNIIVNLFGLESNMQAGTYEFTPQMSLLKVVLKIKNGEVIPPLLAKIILPEGISIYKIGKLLEKEGLSDGIAFRKLTEKRAITEYLSKKYSFISKIPTSSLEGYLFPDTYLIQSDVSAPMLAGLMLARFKRVVIPYWNKNKSRTKYSLHEILTLASIIEKEAAVGKERPIISSVYHNRLNVRMHLGADPTIKYALNRPGKIVSYEDLKVKSPYNTYIHFGLPPGPICNPGIESIKAAIYPSKTDFIYFVAKADGSHIFSTNWRDHEKAKTATRKDRYRKIFKRK